MFLPLAFQAGGPEKSCPATALPRGHCLSQRSYKCLCSQVCVFAWLHPGDRRAGPALCHILTLLEGKGFPYGRGATLSHAMGHSLRWACSQTPIDLPVAHSAGQAAGKSGCAFGFSVCKGARPPWAGVPSELVFHGPGAPASQGLALGQHGALGRRAGRQQQLAGAAEAEEHQQAMPAHPSKVLGAGKHEGGQSPSVLAHQPGHGWALRVGPGMVSMPGATTFSV